jgi:hypothetical protein
MYSKSKVARPFVVLAAMLFTLAGALSAQQGGKIEGRVFDAGTNQPLAGAQVVVVGTRYGNITNADGYYFINNVPAGVHDIRAQYIGYQVATVTQQRVLSGQTTRVDFRLPQQAVELEAITVQGDISPLAPRDRTVTKAIVTGDVVDELPIDNIRSVITLQPGVVETGDSRGQVIRGGRPGEASVYVDGVLVRNFNSGSQSLLNVGVNAVEEVNLLLGGYGAEFGSAQSGIINYVTKQGQTRYTGALAFGTDAFLPKDVSWGHSRLEASLGGPIVSDRVGFHLALTATGMEDASPDFLDDVLAADSIPVQRRYFRPTGTEQYVDANGQPVVDDNGNPVTFTTFEEIDDLGNRQPYSNQDQYTASGTLHWSLGSSTRLTLGALKSRSQGMNYSSAWQARPKGLPAFVNSSSLLRGGLEQILFQTAESQASVRLNVAYGQDKTQNGQRADTTSLEPEGPDFLGFKMSSYEFLFEDKITYERYAARLDSINAGLASQPLTLVETIGLTTSEATPLFDQDNSADNPYGILGYITGQGLSGYGEAVEKTLTFDVDLDWQANRIHRFGAGFEMYKKEVTNLGVGTLSTFFHNVYRVKPTIAAVWVKDRMDIGEMVLDLGLRYDYFDTDAKYPEVPGLVLPFAPDNTPDGLALCAAPPATPGGTCLPRFVEQDAISTLSPRLGVAFPVTEATNFRLSYGHFFQIPQFTSLFSNINTDLSKSNTNSPFGRPIEAMKAVQFEAGISHLFNSETILDVTAYNKDKLADASFRISLVRWPSSRQGPQDARLLTGLDFGNTKGLDVRLTRRMGEGFTTIVGYSYLNARGTGADPLSYINSFGRFTDPVTGAPLTPAQALQFQDFDQRHKFSLAMTANWGRDEENSLLRNTNISVTSLAGSGFPFTRSSTPSTSGRGASGARFVELINASRMPWTFTANARLTRGVNIGGTNIALFADARNLLNTRNQVDVYGYTGSPTDPGDIENEAGGTSGSAQTISAESDPIARLQLERQQQIVRMYGFADEDDDVLSVDEQRRARALNYVASERIETNYGAPRQLRFGFEWVF